MQRSYLADLERGYRKPRRTILDRLLQLNHERHAGLVARGFGLRDGLRRRPTRSYG
jgi:hypothetical protein